MLDALKSNISQKFTNWAYKKKLKQDLDNYLQSLDVDVSRAFKNPVGSQEELQKAWNNPLIIDLDNKRKLLLSTVVSVDEEVPTWFVSARIFLLRNGTVKLRSLWMNYEINQVYSTLEGKIFPLGNSDTTVRFDTSHSAVILRQLNAKELELYHFNNSLK